MSCDHMPTWTSSCPEVEVCLSQNMSHVAFQPLLPQLPVYEQAGIVLIRHLGFSVFCFVLFCL